MKPTHYCRAFVDQHHRLCPFCGRDDSIARLTRTRPTRQSPKSVLLSIAAIFAAVALLWTLCALTIGGAP